MASNDDNGLRIDKWLWHVRFYKTRGIATEAVRGGHVLQDDVRAKPASRVRVGDRLTIRRNRFEYRLTVLALPARRGSATVAQAAYREDDESRAEREAARDRLKSDRMSMPVTTGRPDRETRRALRQRRRGPDT